MFCAQLPLQHCWVWFAFGFGYYGDRSGSRRGQEGLFETEKERSVTVINVLAETETVDSQGPVVSITVLRNMLARNQRAVSQSTRTV